MIWTRYLPAVRFAEAISDYEAQALTYCLKDIDFYQFIIGFYLWKYYVCVI